MERFDFFFGLHLGGWLYSHTNNLSKDLQGTGWRLVLVHQATPKLPKITLEGSVMRLLILSSSFLKHHTEKVLIQGRYLGMQLSILELML